MRWIGKFIQLESSGGILLIIFACLALLFKNSALAILYDKIANPYTLFWLNNGFMTLFFLLVGLELKREIFTGHLSEKSQRNLPFFGALGGIICPAIIYLILNYKDKILFPGWAIPTATDTAFALAILSLLKKHIPESLKSILLSLSIFDDIVTVLIIGLFYTAHLSIVFILISFVILLILFLLNYYKIQSLKIYLLLGLILWFFILKSGFHAAIAGVLLAFFIPLNILPHSSVSASPLRRLEKQLHPFVAFLILPLFAFCNIGIAFNNISLNSLLHPLTLSIILGLFLGKQLGVMLFSFLGIKLKLCRLPKEISWLHYYGMALLTGIGFTISLFIGDLAFSTAFHQTAIRLGVLIGSLCSALLGILIILLVSRKN